MNTNAQRQAAYRSRYTKRTQALKAILDKLDGNTKALAIELRNIATEGLA